MHTQEQEFVDCDKVYGRMWRKAGSRQWSSWAQDDYKAEVEKICAAQEKKNKVACESSSKQQSSQLDQTALNRVGMARPTGTAEPAAMRKVL